MTKQLMLISLISLSIALLTVIILIMTQTSIAMEEKSLQAIGQVLSTMDIACGLAIYYQAGKGKPHLFLYVLPTIAAPIYGLLGGLSQTVTSYLVIALIIQSLATYRYWKTQATHEAV